MVVQFFSPRRQPLPGNPYSQTLNSAAHSAYDQCLQREHEAINDVQLLYTRCLVYLITEAPDDDARDYISIEILACMATAIR